MAVLGIGRLREEEDLLAFLPTTDPDVVLFKDVSRKFGGLRVALVGVEAPTGQDVFSRDTLQRIQKTHDAIKNVRGVDNVLSLANATVIVSSPVGAKVEQLLMSLPENEKQSAALRATALASEVMVGNMVSKDGRAAVIMAFLADGAGDRQVTAEIRRVAGETLGKLPVFYAGAPFAGASIYDEAQADVRRLSPVALLVLLIVVVLSFRDPVGVLLTVSSVVFSVMVVLGGMGWVGDKWTVASGTLPVLLFASGSSYAVHVLGRYYILRGERKEAPQAARESLTIVGPPLLIAAATTAVGFLSFVATDVQPMRAFGIGCGAGVLVCWITALTLVPAVVTLFPRKGAPESRQLKPVGQILVWVWNFGRRQRFIVSVAALVTVALLISPMLKVRVRMEPRAFFSEGSEPWQAEAFMERHFGGAHFMQIALHGDFDDPWTLRELQRLCDYTRALPGVVDVQSILLPLREVSNAMNGAKRLPATAPQAANLYFFIEGQGGISQLIAEGRRDVLVQVRMKGDATAAVAALEKWVTADLRGKPEAPSAADIGQRVAWVLQAEGRTNFDRARIDKTLRVLAPPSDGDAAWIQKRREIVRAFVNGEEAPPLDAAAKQKLDRAALEGGDLRGPIVAAAPSKEEGELAAGLLASKLADDRRNMAIERALPLVLEAAGMGQLADERLRTKLWRVVDDLFVPAAPSAAQEPLSAKVAGEPILDRGFSRSVEHNQWVALAVTVVVVLLLLLGLFRSPRRAAVCMVPAVITMVILFGVMGLRGIHIDLGTSLVAGITTGAGADFAMHYIWYLRRQSADEVSRTVGPINLVGVGLVSLGFFVLGAGKSPIMRLFGTLAGAGMSVSALLTCLLVPALLNKVESGGSPTPQEDPKS